MHELHHHNDSTSQPGRDLAAVLARFDRHRRTLGDRAVLGMADMRILWLFTDGTPRALRTIAHELGLEQSTVNRQVNAALDAGLLSRHREQGVNAYLFESTEKGRALFETNLGTIISTYDTALLSLGHKKTTQLLTLFGELTDAYGEIADNEN